MKYICLSLYYPLGFVRKKINYNKKFRIKQNAKM